MRDLRSTLQALARRYPGDSPDAERATVVLAKRFTRAQLSEELERLEDDLQLERLRRVSVEQLNTERPMNRAIELCRRARQRTYLPLNTRYKVEA